MKYLLVLGALAGIVNAHSSVTHFHINGNADQSCVRLAQSTNPVIDLASSDMACNAVKSNAKSKCSVKGGDQVAFEYRSDPGIPAAQYPLNSDGEKVGVTDVSHMGPCAVYAKKVSDSLTATGPGDGWFKISEDGLDAKGVFCTTRLREADAPMPATIPSTLEPGDYLLRAEMLTLNNAGPKSIGGEEQPQFYPGCVQVTVEGTDGSAKPESTVSIPGYLTLSSPGLIFDVWNSPSNTFSNYPMPGPKPLVASGNSSTPVSASASASAASSSAVATSIAPPSSFATTAAPATTTAEAAETPASSTADADADEDSSSSPYSHRHWRTRVHHLPRQEAVPTISWEGGAGTLAAPSDVPCFSNPENAVAGAVSCSAASAPTPSSDSTVPAPTTLATSTRSATAAQPTQPSGGDNSNNNTNSPGPSRGNNPAGWLGRFRDSMQGRMGHGGRRN